MVQVQIFIGVWHPTASATDLVQQVGFKVLTQANKGDPRGKTAGSKFHESYCQFDAGIVESDSESKITEQVIASISPLDNLSKIVESGGSVWATAKILNEAYMVSISPDEMRKLGAANVGLSYDIS